MSGDGHHITAPPEDGSGAAMAMKLALKDAKISADVIDYVNAHGTSTPLGDMAETRAIKTIFGDHAYKVAISSIKSVIGHSLGAIGSLEMAACALAVDRGVIPPTANLVHPDPECDLDYTPVFAREQPVRHALSVGSGFGGFQSAMVFSAVLPDAATDPAVEAEI
jgi:3-oxoacyl-(acyl-carrier-protein) synthase